MDYEGAFCPVDVDCGSACETRSRSSSAATSSSDGSATTSDEKSGDDKNEDEEEEEKMASEVVEAEVDGKGLHWPKNRFIEEEEENKFKVKKYKPVVRGLLKWRRPELVNMTTVNSDRFDMHQL